MEILGTLGTNVFWVLWHAWLHSPKMLVSSCRRLQCLSACKKSSFCTQFHHSLLSYNITFLRILQFDWLAAFWPITRDPKFFHICWWNINNNISFHFRLFPKKLTWQNVSKNPKTLFWGNSAPFLHKFGKKWISLEKRALSVFQYSNYPPLCQKSEKPNEPFLGKLLDGHTKNWFIPLISSWVLRLIEKSRNLIVGQEHFGPYLRS